MQCKCCVNSCQSVAISTFAFSEIFGLFSPNISNVRLVEPIHVKLADTDMEG